MRRNLILLTFFAIWGSMLHAQTENHWKPDMTLYPNNMTITAVVYVGDEEQKTTDIEIAAFCGEEIRGTKCLKYESDLDRYFLYLTVCGEDGNTLSFKLYNHETDTEFGTLSKETITFVTNGNLGTIIEPYELSFSTPPYVFDGDGNLNEEDFTSETDLIIDGNAIITEGSEITINSLVINEKKSLTIQSGAVLTVNGNVTNTNPDALIIEDGGQIVVYNDNVAATYKKEIITPDGTVEWGQEDNTGWQFVASPTTNVNVNDFIPDNGDYDLYMYDGTQEAQWVNFKKMGSNILYNFNKKEVDDWTTIDADGDGLVWNHYYKSRPLTGYFYSESYGDDGDIKAENYLVSPKIAVNHSTKLSFNAWITYEYDPEYGELPETFKVLVSEKSNDKVNDFVELEDYSITNNSAQNIIIELNKYAGKEIYVAFYHYVEEYGSEQLIIDDVQLHNENTFEKGRGYLVSYQNENDAAEFKGILNYLPKGGSYQMDFGHSDDILAQFNLIGNPFPFDINWATDIMVNNVYNGFATLDAKQGGYVYRNDGIIKAGDGFMIRTKDNYSYISFSKNTSKATRKENNSINITTTSSRGTDNVIISFNDEDNSGFPKLANFNDMIANIYVKEENVNYGIFNYCNDVKEIPLYFEAKEMGNYTINVTSNGKFENVILVDHFTGIETNMLLDDYTFTSTTNDNACRFALKLGNSQQSITDDNFANQSGDNLIINMEGTIQIIDMMGRVVMKEENHDGTINIGELNNATYIVRCVNENEVKTQKIVVL